MATADDEKEELSRIAAEQRRELMAALVADSDLDLAFHLQLEEAIAASLSLQPSSSTASPPEPRQPPPKEDGANNPVYLQSRELRHFETEIQDRVLIQAETKKMHDDLHRRIHDQKLAREILRMPEDEWGMFGDNFERPYGEGSSSRSGVESEVFRVYFKGLLCEERVVGDNSSRKTGTFAGIGVAICDSRDELVFEMRKPLDLGEHDRISRKIVECKALIAALNAAAALDLKRVVFYCDYYTMYQHVIGRWMPTQKKIRMFLIELNALREKFISCEPSLVARNDVKFAFKLAREAIVSQINKPTESNREKLENCVICLEDTSTDQFFSVEGCKHRYCFSCMKQHVEVKLLHGMVPKCPHDGCNSELEIDSCGIFLTPKLLEMMSQRLKEASIPVTDKIYCPYPKCSALMSKMELFEYSRFVFHGAERLGARRCSKCHGDFCINCRVPWHKNMNCGEYKRRNPTPLVEESRLKSLAAKNLWRQCVKCQHMIELAAGCYHITCRCGYEFCYTCGAEWKNKAATCKCPIWDEENIIDTEYEDDDYDEDEYDSDSDDYYF